MEYCELGKTGVRVSRLGFGCMRYHEDEEEAIQAVNRAIDLGINYFETSIGYGNKRSEIILGKAIKGRWEKIHISTKSSPREVKDTSGMRKALEESLRKLQVEKVDFYQMWAVNSPEAYQLTISKGGPLEGARKAKEEGLIGHIGMTSHDLPENIIKMVESGNFESVTIAYNLIQRRNEPVISAAARNEVGVVNMRPLAGGILGSFSEKLKFWDKERDGSPAAAALKFLFINPHIHCIISGMTRVKEVEENVKAVEAPRISEEERKSMQAICDQYGEKLGEKFCGMCFYCVPCPEGIWIPESMRALDAYRLGFGYIARSYYQKNGLKLRDCTQCRQCVEKCPDSLPIPERIEELHSIFGSS